MLGHINIGMTYDALDGSQVNAQGLHLRYISMAAAVGSKDSNAIHVPNCFFENVTEVCRITWGSLFAYFPYKLHVRVSKRNCIGT